MQLGQFVYIENCKDTIPQIAFEEKIKQIVVILSKINILNYVQKNENLLLEEIIFMSYV